MNARSETDHIANLTQALNEALQPIIDAVLEFIERVREVFARIASVAKAHLARCIKEYRVRLFYNRLRAWHFPHILATVIAYLWVMKRWPPHTVLAG